MKRNSIFLAAVIALFFITTLSTGCKPAEEDPIVTEQTLSFHIHTKAGSTIAAYDTELQDSSGRKFTLQDLRYYISNIVLLKNDGTSLPLTGKVILVGPDNQDYELGKVPVGSYDGFRFMVGLDSITNHSDPTTYPSGNPLALQSPGIHWSWNSGYIFMKVDGEVDTTLAATGSPDTEFFFHIGADNLSRTIDFSTAAFTVESASAHEILLTFDFLKALAGVDLRTENTHTMDNMPLAEKMADNWQEAFSVE
jgi:hypothetical protein